MEKKKKNRAGREIFFKCFKPTVVDDELPFDCFFSSPPPTPKRRLGRSFSGLAAFSKTSLVKRLRSKKVKKDSCRSSSSTDSSPSRSENVAKTKGLLMGSEEILRSSSAPSLLFSSTPSAVMTSSSRSSSISSNSRSNSINLKQTNLPIPYRQQMLTGQESGKYCISTHDPGTMTGGMMSFMICLLCVVVWGKVFAILACTSTWFYFSHTRTHLSDSDSEVNSDEYRKKVILQGSLERHSSFNYMTT